MEYDAIEFASYADDTTLYTYGQSFDQIIEKLEMDMSKICEWFHHNGFKTNPGKIMGSSIKTSKVEILLRVTIDSDLTFKEHVTSICSKANRKLHALTRVSKYMNLQKRCILMKSFITSHFKYCSIAWMCHSRSLNNNVNHIHEKALHIVY